MFVFLGCNCGMVCCIKSALCRVQSCLHSFRDFHCVYATGMCFLFCAIQLATRRRNSTKCSEIQTVFFILFSFRFSFCLSPSLSVSLSVSLFIFCHTIFLVFRLSL